MEVQAIAGLLHDAAEDQGGYDTLNDIRRRFGADVAQIVSDCTDSWIEPKPDWLLRKEAYISLLPAKAASSLDVEFVGVNLALRNLEGNGSVAGVFTLEQYPLKRNGLVKGRKRSENLDWPRIAGRDPIDERDEIAVERRRVVLAERTHDRESPRLRYRGRRFLIQAAAVELLRAVVQNVFVAGIRDSC